MKKLIFTLSITIMSLTLFGQTAFEKRIIEEINIHRASMDLAPATFDSAAYKIANEQLQYMVKTNSFPPIKVVGEDGKIVVKKLRAQMLENNFTGSGGCVSQTDHISENGIIRTHEELISRIMNLLISDRQYEVNMLLPISPTLDQKYVIGVNSTVSNGKLYTVMVLCEIVKTLEVE